MVQSLDAPQADRLDLISRVVRAIADGVETTEVIAARAQITVRYARYAVHSARLLALLDSGEPPRLTPLGASMIGLPAGSTTEIEFFRSAFESSHQLRDLAAITLATNPPSLEDLADTIAATRGAARTTALRRASTLLSWRRQLGVADAADEVQLSFIGVAPQDAADFESPPPPASTASVGVLRAPGGEEVRVTVDEPGTPSQESTVSPGALRPLPDTVLPSPAPPTATDTAAMGTGEESEEPLQASVARRPLLASSDLPYFRRQVEQGGAILFTGAGFSLAAKDVAGNNLPTGAAFARELWALCYPDEEYDGSSLQDVFEHAERRHSAQLANLLRRRFTIDTASLPEWYATWLSFPWAKVYTLNVDDLESAVARRFNLPREVRSISALRDGRGSRSGALDVVHLNGVATDGPSGVTFSHDQFAQRLARQEPVYAQLAAELLTHSFVFVGSPLEDPLLWMHIGMRQLRGPASLNETRARGFLVSPSLNRARVDKLRAYHIVWVEGTAQDFADDVLANHAQEAQRGLARIASVHAVDSGDERNIIEVAQAVTAPNRRSGFLIGEEPRWDDVREARAVQRDEDPGFLSRVTSSAFAERNSSSPIPIHAVIGTAGSGKTTLLMKTALQLHAEGSRVAWVSSDAEVAPAAIVRYYRQQSAPPVVIVDDAGRYGPQLVPILKDLAAADALAAIVISLRSYHEHQLDFPGAQALTVERHHMGRLTDGDIDRLLEVLERERLLGELRGRTLAERRTAFKSRADRQILVAMIEATSGERFEDKIVQEWQAQEAVAQWVYALVALATSHGYAMSRDEILLACSGGPQELEAVKKLHQGLLLTETSERRFLVRHRVIAEKLVEELSSRGAQLERLVIGFCRALAIQTSMDEPRGSRRRRVLKRMLNHNVLLRLLEDVELARAVYSELETALDSDYHFWLQRGCLELEAGEIGFAQNYIDQSASMSPSDPLVETARAHMHLRRAVAAPAAPDAVLLASGAFDVLRRLITARGAQDAYPAHVFGSQALAWCRRAGLIPRDRRALLREAREIVERAEALHRSRQELRQLAADLRREELSPPPP